jgi:hypothetical protein
MLFEYAVEPKVISTTWQSFRYFIEKFGFDRGRLIAQFPKEWVKEVYASAGEMKPIERQRFVETLNLAKRSKLVRSGRPYDPALGGWLDNAVAQQGTAPFHAIIAHANPTGSAEILVADEVDENHPLMVSPHTWEVQRSGAALAQAMGPLLRSARTILFVDRYFDPRNPRYKETLRACLQLISAAGGNPPRIEIHFCDHDTRPSAEIVERDAPKWLHDVLPDGLAVSFFAWNEIAGGADFHARYLLTDLGGMNVESGFDAQGAHQNVQIGLLSDGLARQKFAAFARNAGIYQLVEPVLQVRSDGSVLRET